MTVVLLAASFAVILIGAKLFTNSVEWAGSRLGMTQGAVGSLLAAVGTALPETMIAVVAIFHATGEAEEVAIGAIIGAPFMLATIAMVVVGVSVIAYSKRRPQGTKLVVHEKIGRRDLVFFATAFSAALVVSYLPQGSIRVVLAFVFVAAYMVYFIQTLRTEGTLSEELDPLTFAKQKSSPPSALIALQLLVSLGLIVGSANLFVEELIRIAESLGASPLILALVLAPLATELPEKANSVFWVRDGKDTLAMGNITGAMVFQSTIPIALGLAFTDWKLEGIAVVSIILGVAGAVVVGTYLRLRSSIGPPAIAACAALYMLFIGYIVFFA